VIAATRNTRQREIKQLVTGSVQQTDYHLILQGLVQNGGGAPAKNRRLCGSEKMRRETKERAQKTPARRRGFE
jgi:hypothetical protein